MLYTILEHQIVIIYLHVSCLTVRNEIEYAMQFIIKLVLMFHIHVLINYQGYSYQIVILVLTDHNLMMIYLYEGVHEERSRVYYL